MLKYLLILFFLALSLNFTQSSGYQTASASANLIVPLSIETGPGDLDFGDILVSKSGSKEKISPQNGKEFVVKGELNRNITVVYNDVELSNNIWLSNNNGSSGSLTFTPNVRMQNNKKVKSGDNVMLSPNGLIGEMKFKVGGTIDIQQNQPVGDYEGIFVISVTY